MRDSDRIAPRGEATGYIPGPGHPYSWLCGKCHKPSTLRGSRVINLRGLRTKVGPCCRPETAS